MAKENTSSNATERTVDSPNDLMAMTKYVAQMNALGWHIKLVDGKALWLPSRLAEMDEATDPAQKNLAPYTPSIPPAKKKPPSVKMSMDPLHPVINCEHFRKFDKSKYPFTCLMCHNRFPKDTEVWWNKWTFENGKSKSFTLCGKCFLELGRTQLEARG